MLTDISTAAGAEVFAAAIRGNNRGKVVGVTTYGKAIVQQFIPLPSGGGVQMTVAHYTTPDLKADHRDRRQARRDRRPLLAGDPRSEGQRTPKKATEDLILNKALSLFGAAPGVTKKAA